SRRVLLWIRIRTFSRFRRSSGRSFIRLYRAGLIHGHPVPSQNATKSHKIASEQEIVGTFESDAPNKANEELGEVSERDRLVTGQGRRHERVRHERLPQEQVGGAEDHRWFPDGAGLAVEDLPEPADRL